MQIGISKWNQMLIVLYNKDKPKFALTKQVSAIFIALPPFGCKRKNI
jgi:hypothetical protein